MFLSLDAARSPGLYSQVRWTEERKYFLPRNAKPVDTPSSVHVHVHLTAVFTGRTKQRTALSRVDLSTKQVTIACSCSSLVFWHIFHLQKLSSTKIVLLLMWRNDWTCDKSRLSDICFVPFTNFCWCITSWSIKLCRAKDFYNSCRETWVLLCDAVTQDRLQTCTHVASEIQWSDDTLWISKLGSIMPSLFCWLLNVSKFRMVLKVNSIV